MDLEHICHEELYKWLDTKLLKKDLKKQYIFIEDGHLMSKFGNTHGPPGSKTKITAGCFDSKQLRLATAGSDGTVLIWNFSNG